MKKILSILCLSTLSFGLDFGNMGNISLSLGGAGVALQNSPFGAYYNPALISIDNKIRFGYSLGGRYEEKNIDVLQKGIANKDAQIIQDALKENYLNFTSQNGISLQISPAAMRGTFGSLGLAYFGSFYSNASLLEQKDNQAILRSMLLSEIPLTYARTFFFKNTNLDIGINLKYMHASFFENPINLHSIGFTHAISDLKNHFLIRDGKHQFGVDVGMTFGVDLPRFHHLKFGFVAKNLNTPSFAFENEKIAIKPQYRVGIAYNQPYVTLAFDADILPNDMFVFSKEKQQSQMIGGGLKFDLKTIDMRIGAMYDIRQDYGTILTSGINILGLFDIALQIGTKGDVNFLPRYLALQIGGSFSF